MTESLGLSPKPSETQIPLANKELLEKLEAAMRECNLEELSLMASNEPREIFCWAALAISIMNTTELKASSDKITAYSFARIGYHRGLDTLRASGWRGSGYVKASHNGNRGFLICLAILAYLAGQIGELDEELRCKEFLTMLDPSTNFDVKNSLELIDFLFNKEK